MKPFLLTLLLLPSLLLFSQVKIMDINDLTLENVPHFFPNVNGKVLVSENHTSVIGGKHYLNDPPFFPGFPIYEFPGVSVRGGVVHDLDQDGSNELIYCFGNQVYVYSLSGELVQGWPASLDHNTIGSPAIGDIDDDGFAEVVITTDYFGISGELYAFEHTGGLVPGFPINYDGAPMRTPVLADLDHDDALEIVVNIRMWPEAHVHVYNGDASSVEGWPVMLDYIPGAPCAVGDITGDSIPEVIAVSYWSVYAFFKNGDIVPGFPFTPEQDIRAFSYSSPVLADIDEDGLNEIIIGGTTEIPQAQNGGVYVLNGDGTLVSGWPKYATYWIFAPVSVADLSGDGHLDIIVGDQVLSPTPTNAMYGWDKDGNPLPGFPLTGQDAVNTQAMIGDVDNDNMMEFIFEDNLHQGRYHLHNHDATEMELYTLNPDGSTFFNNPTLSDADGDGDLDISAAINDVQTQIGDLYFWDVPVFYSEEFMPLPVLQYNNRHTGVYGEYNWTITGSDGKKSLPHNFNIYPNPFTEEIFIDFSENTGEIQFSLFDVTGKVIVNTRLGNNTVSVGSIKIKKETPSGIYFYKIINEMFFESGILIKQQED